MMTKGTLDLHEYGVAITEAGSSLFSVGVSPAEAQRRGGFLTG
jgi:hypothetical protein